MSGILSSHAWHCSEIEKRPGEFLGFCGRVEKGKGFEHVQAGVGGIRIALLGLPNDKR